MNGLNYFYTAIKKKSLNAYWQLHTKYTNHSQSQFYNLTYLIKISVYCQCETTWKASAHIQPHVELSKALIRYTRCSRDSFMKKPVTL